MRALQGARAAGLVLVAAVVVLALAVAQLTLAAGDRARVDSRVVTSHDGTRLFTTLFLPEGASAQEPVPLVLRSHGWGTRGERQVGTGTLARLLEEGYAVLTWDHRGFGRSEGASHLMDPRVEGRDAQALLDWVVAEVPEVAREPDDPRDPVVGMTGSSYGGAMQLTLAALDDRVDAIAPESAWMDLRRALHEGDVVNRAWSRAVYRSGAEGAGSAPGGGEVAPATYAEELTRVAEQAAGTSPWPEPVLDFLARRSLAGFGEERPVDVPTLVLQGTVDTFFDLGEGVAIAGHVADQGAPVRMVQFCGGHVACPEGYREADDREYLDDQIVRWFARYLRGRDRDPGPALTYRTNEGAWRSADRHPVPTVDELTARGSGEVRAVEEAVDVAGRVARPAGGDDPGTVRVELGRADDGPLELVGVPRVTVTAAGERPVHLFARLVHREAGHVVNGQETPVRLEADDDGARSVAMTAVAYTLPAGDHLDLEVSTGSAMHERRGQGTYEVTVEGRAPVVARPGPR